jgi:hypothetical protein
MIADVAQACGAIDHPFIEVQVTLQNQKHQDARRALIRMLGEGKCTVSSLLELARSALTNSRRSPDNADDAVRYDALPSGGR